MRIKFEHFFDAAHQLPDSKDLVTKKCTNLHGHTYRVIVSFQGAKAESGLLTDFAVIKGVIDELDHKFLNDILDFPTTAENIAEHLRAKIEVATEHFVDYVRVYEGWKGKEIYAEAS